MPTTTDAYITPKVLRWARERASATPNKLAKKLNVKAEAISSWESGDAKPSLRQAEQLARKLHVPFAYLFLPNPPEEKVPLPDFRTIKNAAFKKPTPEFIDLLHDILAKHTWYREFAESEGRTDLPFVGSKTLGDPPADTADAIASTLDVTNGFRQSCRNWEQFLSKLIRQAEAKDVLVMRTASVAGNPHRKVSVNEFRGFAISDKIAPLVCINSADFKAAQIFTLAHEMAHIWLGQTGISNENLVDENPGTIEQTCDAIATEFLAPKGTFLQYWGEYHGDVSRLAHHFRVSSVVVLRRARDLEQISNKDFSEKYREEERKFKKPQKSGGGSFYNNLLTRNGELFTTSLVTAVGEGRELYREAASLLNVQVATIPKIAEHLARRPSGEK
jgi:Zn-dependent peptidase ImmA (M78 family)/DNA-binding XRE family transcriptional regulator